MKKLGHGVRQDHITYNSAVVDDIMQEMDSENSEGSSTDEDDCDDGMEVGCSNRNFVKK